MSRNTRTLTPKQLDILQAISSRTTVVKFSHAAGFTRFDSDFKVWRQVPWGTVRPLIDGGLIEQADGLNSYRVTVAGRAACATRRYLATGHPNTFVSRAGRDVLAILNRGGTLRRTTFSCEGIDAGEVIALQSNVVAALHRQGYVEFAPEGTVEAWEILLTDSGRAICAEIFGIAEVPHYELGDPIA